jgi:hypothetical protein
MHSILCSWGGRNTNQKICNVYFLPCLIHDLFLLVCSNEFYLFLSANRFDNVSFLVGSNFPVLHMYHLLANRCNFYVFLKNSPVFVEIGVFSVTYESFYNSFKTRGNVDYDTMSVFSQIFNDKAKIEALSKPHLKKFMFSPYASVSVFFISLYILLFCELQF